jgi:hypothetical protein
LSLDFRLTPLPERVELRRVLREQTPRLDPPLQVLADEVLAEGSTIDLVAVDNRGSIVLILIGEEGDDPALFTCAIAHREWIRARAADWLKLAPSLDLRPDAEPRVLLMCPSFRPETRAAVKSAAGANIELAVLRGVSDGEHSSVLIELLDMPERDEPHPQAVERGAFRSGLTEQELGLTAEEMQNFD